MNDIQVFKNDQFGQVRAARGKNGEPVFVAKDICAILDLGNPRSSIALLDDDEKGVHSVDTPGGKQQMATVTEPGFYKLVMRSRKPEAKAFQRWVTHEVLPALRRDGGYMVARDETPEQTMDARSFSPRPPSTARRAASRGSRPRTRRCAPRRSSRTPWPRVTARASWASSRR